VVDAVLEAENSLLDPQEGKCGRTAFALSDWVESLYCIIKCSGAWWCPGIITRWHSELSMREFRLVWCPFSKVFMYW